jgi:hypothetical protein
VLLSWREVKSYLKRRIEESVREMGRSYDYSTRSDMKVNEKGTDESTYGNMWRNPPKGRNPARHLSRFELLSSFFNANVFYVRQTTSKIYIKLYLVDYLRYVSSYGSQACERGRGAKKTHEVLFWRSGRCWETLSR